MGYGIVRHLKYVAKCLLDIIYYKEERCVSCGTQLYNDRIICIKCENKIKRCFEHKELNVENYKVNIYSALYYSSVVKGMIIKLKYKSNFTCGDLLARYMIELIDREKLTFDVITYVPLSYKASKKRGYNQSEYLSLKISQKYNKKVVKVLKKIKETKDQIGLNSNERWQNLSESFSSNNLQCIKNKNILLVDDVITTGATSYYCASVLLKNGANKIIILTAAKSKI